MTDLQGPALTEPSDHASHQADNLFKAFYFLFFAGLAALAPFVALYYEGLGLDGRQIGVLTAIPPLIALFAASLWGGLADATHQHRRLLALAMAGAIVCVLAVSLASSFLLLGVLIIGYAFFFAPINPLVDNSAMEMLGARRSQYGRLRLWGSVGWGLSAPLIGRLVEVHGLRWSFFGYALIMSLGLVIILRLPISETSIGGSFWRGFRVLMARRRWILFLIVVFVAGLGAGILNNYLFLYMNQLGAGETMMGLALTVATISELAVFALSGRMLERWGTGRMLGASIVAMVIRMLAYSVVATPWAVLVIQLLHGFTFAALWTAGVSYANSAAPRGMGATAQGVFSGVTMGLAAATGALVGGWLYQGVGAVMMFRWAGIGIALALLAAAMASRYLVDPQPAAANA
ncbi:MAG: major facilitator superfamily domain-containing protein 6 [Caldilineales bacterium]